MRISGSVQMRNGFADYGIGKEATCKQIVRETALDVVELAQALAPVKSGALRASIHAVTDDGSGYEAAAYAVETLSEGHAEVFPQVEPTQPLEAIVAVAAGHGIFAEYGTVDTPAHPFFTPAVESNRGRFQERLNETMNR